MVIDNTKKTRALFEINKGTNKNSVIDVNSNVKAEDRRIPFNNMIYIADGPSDVSSFLVVKSNKGKAYGFYNPERLDIFAENEGLRHEGRIDHYGAAQYFRDGNTENWLALQIHQIADLVATNR